MRLRLMDVGLALTVSFGVIALVSLQLGSPYVEQYGSQCANAPQVGDCPNIWYQASLYSFLTDAAGTVAVAGIIVFVIGVVRARRTTSPAFRPPMTTDPSGNQGAPNLSGERLMACPRCGASVKMSDRFCGTCGFQGRG